MSPAPYVTQEQKRREKVKPLEAFLFSVCSQRPFFLPIKRRDVKEKERTKSSTRIPVGKQAKPYTHVLLLIRSPCRIVSEKRCIMLCVLKHLGKEFVYRALSCLLIFPPLFLYIVLSFRSVIRRWSSAHLFVSSISPQPLSRTCLSLSCHSLLGDRVVRVAWKFDVVVHLHSFQVDARLCLELHLHTQLNRLTLCYICDVWSSFPITPDFLGKQHPLVMHTSWQPGRMVKMTSLSHKFGVWFTFSHSITSIRNFTAYFSSFDERIWSLIFAILFWEWRRKGIYVHATKSLTFLCY